MYTDSSVFRKEAFVGSLLTYTIDNFSSYKLAIWYRVIASEERIVKMKTIKSNDTLSYRSSVFDVGSII